MKRLFITLVFLGSSAAMAQTTPAVPAPVGHPCKQMEQACSAAGFVKHGQKQGKGIHKNCMKPLLAGQSVPGVTVDSSVIQACQQRKASKTK